MANITFDPEKFQLTIVRLKKGGNTYEIVVDPDQAILFREQKISDIDLVVKSYDVFADAQKGLHALASTFEPNFGTQNTGDIIKVILVKGELHLTAEYKKTLRERKRQQICVHIQRNAVDPRTNLPHPLARIESAMEQAKVRIDEFESVQNQVKLVLPKLRELLPIRFEEVTLQVHIPAQHAAKAYGFLNQRTNLKRGDWKSDGSLLAICVIPGGIRLDFIDDLQKLVHGCAEVDLQE